LKTPRTNARAKAVPAGVRHSGTRRRTQTASAALRSAYLNSDRIVDGAELAIAKA